MSNSVEKPTDTLDQLIEQYQQPTSSIVETLEKYSTLVKAATALPSDQFDEFCVRVGLDQASEAFRYQQRLGSRYSQWAAALGNEKAGVAFLYLFSVSDLEFEEMVKDGTELMVQLEEAEDYKGIARHSPIH